MGLVKTRRRLAEDGPPHRAARKQQRAKVLWDVIEFGMRSATYPHSYREQNFNSKNPRLKSAGEWNIIPLVLYPKGRF